MKALSSSGAAAPSPRNIVQNATRASRLHKTSGLRRLAQRPDRHDLIGIHNQGKRPLVREDHQIPGIRMHHCMVGMRQQVRVPARQRDLDRKIHWPPQQSFQRSAHASVVVPQPLQSKLFYSASAACPNLARASCQWFRGISKPGPLGGGALSPPRTVFLARRQTVALHF